MSQKILLPLFLFFSLIAQAQIAPIAINDTATTNEDNPLAIAVLLNDFDDDSLNIASVAEVLGAVNGTVAQSPQGVFNYTPNPNYTGVDSFLYAVCDNGSPILCDTATVYINVLAVNDTPTISQPMVLTSEDIPVAICPTFSDIDDPISLISVFVCNASQNGSLVAGPTANCFTYTPNPNFNGFDTLCIGVCDTLGACATIDIVCFVDEVNDTPTISQPMVVVPEDSTIIICPTVDDVDDINSLLNVSVCNNSINGTTNSVVGMTQCFEYTPNANFNGFDTICLSVCDPLGACGIIDIVCFVTEINDAPIAIDDYENTIIDAPVTVDVLVNDSDVDTILNPASVIIIDLPANGTVNINPTTGEITYIPNSGFFGVDSFMYNVCDSDPIPLCDSAWVIINVNEPHPIAVNDTINTNINTLYYSRVLLNDIMFNLPTNFNVDININTFGIQSTNNSPNGTYTVSSQNKVYFQPNTNFSGIDSVQYSITSNSGLSDTAFIYSYVFGNNTPPVLGNDTIISDYNTGGFVLALSNDTDNTTIDLEEYSLDIDLNPSNGLAEINMFGPTTLFSYTPDNNYWGIDSFTYYLCDMGLLCDTATIYVNTILNAPPLAANDSAFTDSASLVIVDVLTNDTDNLQNIINNATLNIIDSAVQGEVNINSGFIEYSPVDGFVGLDSFSYSVCDLGLLCDTAIVYIEVSSPAPIFSASAIITSSTCNASCTNTITITATNGVAPYSYSIDGAIFQSSNVFINVCSGVYTVYVQDAMNNIAIDTISSSNFYVLLSKYAAPCFNNSASDSYIKANVYNGNGHYSYQWSDGSDSIYLLNPTDGIHSVIVTDTITGCSYSQSTLFNGSKCKNIFGTVHIDYNGNCIVDTNDIPKIYNSIIIRNVATNMYQYAYSNNQGFYTKDLVEGTYEVSLGNYNSSNYIVICPSSSFTVTLDSLNNSDTLDFFIQPIHINDLQISYHLGVIRPGFYFNDFIQYRNVGSVTANGTVVLQYDSLLSPSLNNSGVVDTLNRTITWSYSNLNPTGLNQYLNPNFEPLNASVPLGTQICNTVTINPIIGDSTPLNNTKTICSTVVGSYDPNQKLVYPEGDILEEQKTHDYHIDFQNLGTYEATFVIVRDNLDDNLDISTLRNVSASHNFVLDIENGDELVFTFNNIHLAAAQDDEPGSMGHIDFTIDQKENLPIGTEIENTADIYFDFNEAIITNTTKNTIVLTSSVQELYVLDAQIYPNPSSEFINIVLPEDNKILKIVVQNVLGEIVFESNNIKSSKSVFNHSKLTNGIYNLNISTKKGTINRQVVISSK